MVLTACSGDDSNTPTSTTAAAVPEPSTSVTTTTAPPEPTTTTTPPTTTTEAPTTTLPPTTTTEPADITPGPIVVSADVPDYDMIDVHTGETVNLRSVVKGDKPLLFWFWSPL